MGRERRWAVREEATRAALSSGSAGEDVAAEEWRETEPYFRQAVEAFREVVRLAGDAGNEARLSLVDALIELGETEPAAEMLETYFESGGRTEDAESLACWLGTASPGAPERGRGSGGVRPVLLTPEVRASVEPPKTIHSSQPRYTKTARRARIQGAVHFAVVITTEGRVECPRILSGPGYGLAEAAVTAARNWRFEPALRDGVPVPVIYQLSTRFTLQR